MNRLVECYIWLYPTDASLICFVYGLKMGNNGQY
jgi:hypothetical protein